MRLKKLLSCLLAGVMAVSTMAAATVTASAEEVLGTVGTTGWNATVSGDTITYSDAWSGSGWWIGGADYSAYDEVAVEYKDSTVGMVKLIVEYGPAEGDSTGTSDSTLSTAAGTIKVELDATKKSSVKQIYLQNEKVGSLTVVSGVVRNSTDMRGSLALPYDGSPITMTKTNPEWQPTGAAQANIEIASPEGVTYGTTTYGELKKSFKSITASVDYVNDSLNVGASAFTYCVFVQSGVNAEDYSNWTASGGTALGQPASLSTDGWTNGGNAIPDTAVINKVGIQINAANPLAAEIANLEANATFEINSAAAASYNVTVSDAITNGTVTADKAKAEEGETVTVTATPAAGFALDKITVTGASGEVIVTDGKFTMPAEEVTVSASFKKLLTGIELSSNTASLMVGKTQALTVSPVPSDAADYDAAQTVWASSDEKVATVENGTVTAVAEGSATITATNGTFKAECVVTVTKEEIKCTGITLGASESTIKAGDSMTIAAAPTPANATDFDASQVKWSSDKADVASVENGKIKGNGRGTATITATYGDFTATMKVNVTQDIASAVAAGQAMTKKIVTGTNAAGVELHREDAVCSISAADVQKASAIRVTITDKTTGKKVVKDVKECYKQVIDNGELGTDIYSGYFVVISVKNVPATAQLEYSYSVV